MAIPLLRWRPVCLLTTPGSRWTTWKQDYAPTNKAQDNLLREEIAANAIHITGNTAINALLDVVQRLGVDLRLKSWFAEQFSFIDSSKRLILVTGHRRENFGIGLENICHALRQLAERGDIQIIYPVHLNSNVQEPVRCILGQVPNVHL